MKYAQECDIIMLQNYAALILQMPGKRTAESARTVHCCCIAMLCVTMHDNTALFLVQINLFFNIFILFFNINILLIWSCFFLELLSVTFLTICGGAETLSQMHLASAFFD